MANWLGKATAALSREPEAPPPPFALTCECGQEHQGLRKSRAQRIICQSCGTALFVLPKNVYPPPPARKKKRRSNSGPPQGPSLPPVTEVATYVFQRSTAAASKVGHSVRRRGLAARTSMQTRRREFLTFFRSQFTPFRVVLVSITGIIVATALWTWRSRQLEAASQAFQSGFEQGQQALAEGDLTRAREQFALAAAAADSLQLSDPQSRLLSQLERETTALTRLSPDSLYDMVLEAEKTLSRQNAKTWDDAFRARYLDSWIIFDGMIAPATAGSTRQTSVVFPLTVGSQNRSIDVHADWAVWQHWQPLDVPRRVIFAAQLEQCSLSADRTTWVVTLRPETGFLWCHQNNLHAAGFLMEDDEADPELAACLREQSEVMDLP